MRYYTRVVIVTQTDPLKDNEITAELKANPKCCQAIIQLIDQTRAEFAGSAPTCAGQNNALAMARDVGAHEALTGLILELERRRTD